MKKILLMIMIAVLLVSCAAAGGILPISPDEASRQVIGVWSFWSGGEIIGDAVEFCTDGTAWTLVPQNQDVYPFMDPQRTGESQKLRWHIEEGNADQPYWENLLIIDPSGEKYGIAFLENGCMHIAYGEGGGTYARNYEQELRAELGARREEEKSEFDWLLEAYLNGSFTASCAEQAGLNVDEITVKRIDSQWQLTVDTTTGLFEVDAKEIRYYADEDSNLWWNDGEPEALWNTPQMTGAAAKTSKNIFAILRASVEWNWTGPAAVPQPKEESYQQPEESYEAPGESYQAPEESYEAPEESYEAPEETYQQPEEPYQQPEEPQPPVQPQEPEEPELPEELPHKLKEPEQEPTELVGTTEKWKNGKVYPVYYGPAKAYGRGAKGKASVSTNDVLTVYGRYKGCLLVSYEVSKNKIRFGWILPADLSSKTIDKYGELEFSKDGDNIDYFCGVLRQAADLTDDPVRSRDAITHMPAGNSVHVLAGYGDWYYVEGFVDGKLAMGFVPKAAVDREHGYVLDAKLTIDKAVSFSREDILAAMETVKNEIYENWRGTRLLELKYVEAESADADDWWQDAEGKLLGMQLFADLNDISMHDYEMGSDVISDYGFILYRKENGAWWVGNWGYE